ncbi:MAG: hypothetical protein HQK66_04020 [Desulfamplus sp.]|nr:hypothetical protein [Desulfamplus sp.]
MALEHRIQAYHLCKNIDEDDIPFIALSLHLKAVFWTGDKQLKTHLRQMGFVSFFEPQ